MSDNTELTDDQVKGLAREIAGMCIQEVRSLEGPVVWVTGNAYMPPMRSFVQGEKVHQASNNEDGELFAFLVEEVERLLQEAEVYMDGPEWDNSLYVVDLRRWEYDEDDEGDDLNDGWKRK